MAEYFYLLEGKLRLRVGGEDITMAKGDLVVVEPGEAHEVLRATPDARLLLLIPPTVENDKEELEQVEESKGYTRSLSGLLTHQRIQFSCEA